MERDDEHQIVVVPPLIRREITAIQPEEGNYIHGYMVNAGFADTVESFHTMHPEVPLRFFWDKTETEEVVRVDETLSYHQIDDVKFLNGMANCRAYASTAGFESICEAMYLGKPVLMVPAHIEQDCNAYDAMIAGAGIIGDSFELSPCFVLRENIFQIVISFIGHAVASVGLFLNWKNWLLHNQK